MENKKGRIKQKSEFNGRKNRDKKKERSKPNESQGWQWKVRHRQKRQNREAPECT